MNGCCEAAGVLGTGVYVQLSGRSDSPKTVELPASGTLKQLKSAVRNALRPVLDGKASYSLWKGKDRNDLDILHLITIDYCIKFKPFL